MVYKLCLNKLAQNKQEQDKYEENHTYKREKSRY